MADLLHTVELQTGENPPVLFGCMVLGADANDFVPIVPELDLRIAHDLLLCFRMRRKSQSHSTVVSIMPAWWRHRCRRNGYSETEDEAGLRKSQEQIEALIAREIERGVSANKIVIAGFSQGCAMSLQVGLRHPQSLAGIMCLSGYLPLADKIADERHVANQTRRFSWRMAQPIRSFHSSAQNNRVRF